MTSATRNYLDFRVEMGAQGPGEYFVIASCREGETARNIKVAPNWTRVRAGSSALESKSVDQVSLLRYGSYLGSLLMPDDVEGLFLEAVSSLREEEGLRVRLVGRSPELTAVPWEYAHVNIPGRSRPLSPYLVLDPRLSLVRHSPQNRPLPTMANVAARPIRVLVATGGAMRGLEPLDGSDALAIADAYRDSGVGIDRVHLRSLTVGSAQELFAALDEPWDVVHFSGHAGEVAGERGLLVPGGDGGAHVVSSDQLARSIANCGALFSVLNSCGSGSDVSSSEIGSVAHHLVDSGVPAVIGMQHQIEDSHAVAFTSGVFRALLTGSTIDEAVSVGRHEVLNLGLLADWGVPALYSRAGNLALARADLAAIQSRHRDLRPSPNALTARIGPELGGRGAQSELIGREAEAKALAAAIDAAVNHGEPRYLLLAGESGVGKSALLHYAIQLAEQRGVPVVATVCEPFHEGMSFFPIRELVRQIAGSETPSTRISAFFGDASPEMKLAMSAESATDPALRRDSLIATFCNLVTLLCRTNPTGTAVVLIDDLERVDPGSADALLCLLARLRETSAIVIGSFRSSDTTLNHPLRPVIRAARRHEAATTLSVGALDRSDLRHLAHQVLGGPCRFSARHWDRLYQETEGNPLFVREILRALAWTSENAGPRLRFRDGAWEFCGPEGQWEVPDSVEDVIRTRLDALDTEERRELELASVIGRRFAYSLMSHLSEQEDRVLLNYMEIFLNLDIIRETRHDDETFEFSHGKIRDVLYQSMSSIRRIRLHKQVAEVLAVLSESLTPEDRTGLLAEHLFQAHEYERTVPIMLDAARISVSLQDFRTATDQFDKAIFAAQRSSYPAGESDVAIRLELAEILKMNGDYDRSEALLREILSASSDQLIEAWAHNHLGDVLQLTGRTGEAIDEYKSCEVAAVELSDDVLLAEVSADLAELLARLAARLSGVDPDHSVSLYQEYEQYLAAGARHAERSGRKGTLARSLRNYGLYHSRRGENERALDYFERALSLGDDVGLLNHQIRIPMAKALRLLGRHSKARHLVEETLNWSLQTGVRRSEAIARQHGAVLAMVESFDAAWNGRERVARLEAVCDELRAALEIHTEVGFEQGRAETENALGEALALMGKLDEAEVHLRRAQPAVASVPDDVVSARAAEMRLKGEGARADRLLGAFHRNQT